MSKSKNKFEHFLVSVFGHLNIDNNFNLARNSWVIYNRRFVRQRISENVCLYNLFTDEFTAFYGPYGIIQTFKWISKCPNKACIVNKNPVCESNAFKLM
jgi:hypothetical protein